MKQHDKQGLLILFLVALLAPAAKAEDKPKDRLLSFDASANWRSQYILTAGGVSYDKPVVQAEFTTRLKKSGFYADFWVFLPADGSELNSNYATEVDYALGWKGKVFEEAAMDVGMFYFDLCKVFHGNRGDMLNPYLWLERGFEVAEGHTITPYAGLSCYLPVRGREPENGFNWFAGARHDWQFCREYSINWGGDILWDDGACGLDSGWLLRGKAGLNWEVRRNITMNIVTASVWTPLTAHDSRETEWVWSSGILFKF